ncbi:GntR family transcriptional regulator [Elioraea tepidiphila]|uniref:GntR family transcriptional regulator n=1 Tax=Elioraea tepidiphila TaxID=457934 RepID=UPI0003695BD1|nr:GntR family transcriptional regulator [Elioraea tepidiphila]
MSGPAVRPVARHSLSGRVYAELRDALMHGRLKPGQRLKLHELAEAMDVSETPVREAVFQLIREGGLEMRTGSAIRVVRLSLADYLELRRIRLLLEGLAAEEAARHADRSVVAALAAEHAVLTQAEDTADWTEAIASNFRFHHLIWRTAAMPNLLGVLEGIWLRNGPLLNFLYPNARPRYPGRHRHEDVIAALRAADPEAAREAVCADLIEGGAALLRLLEEIEAGRVVPLDPETTDDAPKPRRKRRPKP